MKCRRHCCSEIVPPHKDHPNKVYCSKLCKQKDANDRHRDRYPERAAERQARFYGKHSLRKRSYALMFKYGITLEEKLELLELQGGRCANEGCRTDNPKQRINQTRSSWHVDHDHETGRIRGILCSGCNKAAGSVNDDPAKLDGLAKYLRDTKNVDLRTKYRTAS